MNRLNRYALSLLALSVILAIIAGVNATPTQASGSAPVTVVNTPLPVTGNATVSGTVDIGNTPTVNAQQAGPWSVSINGTPTVEVSNLSARVPYNFRLTGGFDANGVMSGNDATYTLPAGKTFEMRHVSCEANIDTETDNPLVLSLTAGTVPNQVLLVSLQVPQLGGYKRAYWITQETHAFLGAVSNRTFGSTVSLNASVWGDHFGFADCYVSGELIN